MAKPNKFSGMMHEFCVDLGYCGSIIDGKPTQVTDFIPKTGKVKAEQFVKWLLLAEGVNELELERHDLKAFKRIFIKHMGSYVVDAKDLR